AGSGRRTIAAALAARAGRTLGTIALAGPGADSIDQLRRDLRDVHLRGWIACVTDLDHAAAADDTSRAALRALLDRHPGPLFICAGTSSALPIAAGHLSLELPALPVAERVKAWTAALAAVHLPTTDAAVLAERYSVGPGAIHHAVAAAALAGTPARTGETIDRVLRQQRAVRLGALASKVEHLASWDDLVLPDELLASVKELVGRVRLRAQVLDGWGMQKVASTGRAVTALLQGGPGTGKTLVAGVIARELGYDLYRVDLSRVTSKWIGETEKNLGELFDAADDGQCILLFDEADSLFGKRTEVKSSNDRHANLEVNYLLQRLDAFEGVAILTTNFGTAIDPAFKRRLSAHLQFPFPDEAERERLWRAHLPASLPVAGDLDLPALARKYALSGGYIRNAALRAAFLAAGERTPLTAEHLRRAVVAEYRDRGKVATTGPLE
ncbi:MAG: ATP-binding protein, partial [Kofleriaceae bacterium]|nr:ATP-binding protein [Kofleriaceae bacterium]